MGLHTYDTISVLWKSDICFDGSSLQINQFNQLQSCIFVIVTMVTVGLHVVGNGGGNLLDSLLTFLNNPLIASIVVNYFHRPRSIAN